MIVAGLDWSYTCPAICVYDKKKPLTFSNCTIYFMTTKIKYAKSFNNIHGFMMPSWETPEERFDNIASWAIQVMTRHGVKEACLEGYSFGSKSSSMTSIAENIGLLKHKMWTHKIAFITPAPSAVKKHFTGKGNANKLAMFESLTERFDIDLPALLNCKATDNPVSDIVDSFAMTDYLINNIDAKEPK